MCFFMEILFLPGSQDGTSNIRSAGIPLVGQNVLHHPFVLAGRSPIFLFADSPFPPKDKWTPYSCPSAQQGGNPLFTVWFRGFGFHGEKHAVITMMVPAPGWFTLHRGVHWGQESLSRLVWGIWVLFSIMSKWEVPTLSSGKNAFLAWKIKPKSGALFVISFMGQLWNCMLQDLGGLFWSSKLQELG